jgi:hypothetical protein
MFQRKLADWSGRYASRKVGAIQSLAAAGDTIGSFVFSEDAMNLKNMLVSDFGLELNIAGGFGQSADSPIVVLDTDPTAASLTEMQVLRSIGRGRGILWRTLARGQVRTEQTALEQVRIETKELTADEVVTQVEGYYFDVSASACATDVLPDAVGFIEKNSVMVFPYELGWLHFDKVIDYETDDPGLGQSICYNAMGVKATIYVYDKNRNDIPSDIESEIVCRELACAVSDFLTVNPSATSFGAASSASLHLQSFKVGGDLSIVGMGASRGKFVKLRVTHEDDPVLTDVVSQSLTAISEFLTATTSYFSIH